MKAQSRLIILILLLATLPFQGIQAQNPFPDHTNCKRDMKEAGLWYFGVFAGVNFNSGDAVA